MAETQIFVCTVETPGGPKDYITLVEPKLAFAHGLAPEAVVGVLSRPLESGEVITPDLFARNRQFVDFLHEVIEREALQQPGFQAEAQRLSNGWVYIIDQRTSTPGGPVPPEDILGGFEVKDGTVVAGSYQANPRHQILSARGFFRLDDELLACLLREMRKRCS